MRTNFAPLVMCAAAALATTLISPRAWSAPPSFQGLGHLPGASNTEPLAISADGSTIVGYASYSNGSTQAFRWTGAGGLQGLGYLPGAPGSRAFGVSGDGSVVIGTSNDRPFRWTSADGIQALSNLPGPMTAISADGLTIVGETEAFGGIVPFRWTSADGIQTLSGGVGYDYASAVSSDGAVIVGAAGDQAFRWTSADGMQRLGSLPGGNSVSVAHAVNLDGSVVVGQSYSASGREAFRWSSAGGMQGLGDLSGGSFESAATSVSADGSIIVGYGTSGDANGNFHEPFIWDSTHGMRNLKDVLINDYGLDLNRWLLNTAIISADGRTIVGQGSDLMGLQHQLWIATIPEPSSLVLLSLGGTLLFFLLLRYCKGPGHGIEE
jgi:probable HAF family extracellular repeat protein